MYLLLCVPDHIYLRTTVFTYDRRALSSNLAGFYLLLQLQVGLPGNGVSTCFSVVPLKYQRATASAMVVLLTSIVFHAVEVWQCSEGHESRKQP